MPSSAGLDTSGATAASPTAMDLHQLRFENAMLRNEKQFLTQAMAIDPMTTARANTARRSADSVEMRLLHAYLMACEMQDADARRVVEAQMQQRVLETQSKVDKLRQLLETVQRDVEEVLQASGGWA